MSGTQPLFSQQLHIVSMKILHWHLYKRCLHPKKLVEVPRFIDPQRLQVLQKDLFLEPKQASVDPTLCLHVFCVANTPAQ